MTVAATQTRNDYVGNGTANVLPYTFLIFAQQDLVVTVVNTATGTSYSLQLNVDYTIDVVNIPAGGNVTLINSGQAWLNGTGYLNTGFTLTIQRVRPLTQTTSIRNQGDFYPEVHEDAFDNCAMVDQQLQAEIEGCVQIPPTINPSAFDTTLPTTLAQSPGAAIVVNPAGTGFSLQAVSGAVGVLMLTYAQLKAAAVLNPAIAFIGYALDINSFVGYCGNPARGDAGFTVLGGD
jgi:hypothetical protein